MAGAPSTDPWTFMTPQFLTGLKPAAASPEAKLDTKPGVARHASAGSANPLFIPAPLWHPDNPLWWFFVIGLFSASGIFASSITVKGRAGPYRGNASVSAGHGT